MHGFCRNLKNQDHYSKPTNMTKQDTDTVIDRLDIIHSGY